jgi:hypothetical protein
MCQSICVISRNNWTKSYVENLSVVHIGKMQYLVNMILKSKLSENVACF